MAELSIAHVEPLPDRPAGRVIFIHGIGQGAAATWGATDQSPSTSRFLHELSHDQTDCDVCWIDYSAPRSNWQGQGMRLVDRATSVLDYLCDLGLHDCPTVYV